VDVGSCFYVGDAAGRPGDHADSDKQFAANIGVTFKTPEELFGDSSSLAGHGGIGSASAEAPMLQREHIANAVQSAAKQFPGRVPIILVLCGFVGSGKSSFAAQLFSRSAHPPSITASSSSSFHNPPVEWVIICQDELLRLEKCAKVAAEALSAGHSVIIDRTNLSPEQRAHWSHALASTVPKKVRVMVDNREANLIGSDECLHTSMKKPLAIPPNILFIYLNRLMVPLVSQSMHLSLPLRLRYAKSGKNC
jgi:bifunctional polynucleotide phosphatase/kinase